MNDAPPNAIRSSAQDITHLSELAKLAIDDTARDSFLKKQSVAVAYIEQLQNATIGDTPPTNEVSHLSSVTRPDTITRPVGQQAQDRLLSLSPLRDGNVVKTARIISK